MASMTVFASTAAYTVADLHAMPDDGRRRELIDGMLFVSPAPGWPHQEMALTLYTLLRAACPPELHVLAAPFAVTTSPVDEVQPDVLVARFADLTQANLPVAPVMAAEVASHSTRLHDRNTKKAHYERLGVSSYWLLDPDGPGVLEVLELGDDGRYRTVAEVVGDETVQSRATVPREACRPSGCSRACTDPADPCSAADPEHGEAGLVETGYPGGGVGRRGHDDARRRAADRDDDGGPREDDDRLGARAGGSPARSPRRCGCRRKGRRRPRTPGSVRAPGTAARWVGRPVGRPPDRSADRRRPPRRGGCSGA